MRVFITVLVLIFSLQSWTKADDISDFEIEGMSIGDSLLDFRVSQSLGIDCGLVYNGHNDINRLKATGAYTFEHIKDFYNWLINT